MEIMGSHKCRIVGKSQSVLVMINLHPHPGAALTGCLGASGQALEPGVGAEAGGAGDDHEEPAGRRGLR
eukprot:COSAG01_NODE_8874_length_2629_cov_12.775889_2_plen_69_part_00